MTIVIDIPEKTYSALTHTEFDANLVVNEMRKAIVNGKPLPKCHKRLIEVTNQLEQELFTFQRYTGIDEAPYENATMIIDDAPTIIEGSDKE